MSGFAVGERIMATEKSLDAKKIGYLRNVIGSGGQARPSGNGPTTSMLRKLAKTGHVAEMPGTPRLFIRTVAGDAALEQFDSGLSAGCVNILRLVKDSQKSGRSISPDDLVKGITRCVEGGLVHVRSSGGFVLTHSGERALDARAD